jgi:hypothetical protein
MSVWESQYDLVGEGHRRFYGTAPPASASDTAGLQLNVGDFIWNTNPSLGGVLGWFCITAGSPGTWIEVEGNAGVAFTFTAVQVDAMSVTPLVLVPAQGAGTVIEVVSCLLELVYGSAVFAGGGAIGLYYSANTGPLASTTVAATFLTTPTVNQVALMTDALASAAASTVENEPLVLSNATAPFTAGTGSTLNVRLKYRLHSGLA